MLEQIFLCSIEVGYHLWSRVGLIATATQHAWDVHCCASWECPLDLCMLHNGPKCRIYYIMSDGSVEVFLLYHWR
jgi:hypothetical protein